MTRRLPVPAPARTAARAPEREPAAAPGAAYQVAVAAPGPAAAAADHGPRLAAQRQRSAAWSAAPAVVQRFKRVGGGYTVHQGPGAPAPFTEKGDTPQVGPRTGQGSLKAQATGPAKPGLGVSYPTQMPALPPLKLSDDDTLAVNATAGEPKEMYATDAVVNASNTRLAEIDSPMRLQAAGNDITVPLAGGGGQRTLKMFQPQNQELGIAQDARHFENFVIDICRDIAKSLLGTSAFVGVVGSGDDAERVPLTTANGLRVPEALELANQLTEEPDIGVEDAAEAMQTPRRGDPEGKAYGKALRKGELGGSATTLGINERAKAKVGQAYLTQTVEAESTGKKDYSQASGLFNSPKTHDFVWGYHYAAVAAVSEDGADHLTLENYQRGGELRQVQEKLLAQLRKQYRAEAQAALASLPANASTPDKIGAITHRLENGAVGTGAEARQAYSTLMAEEMGALGRMWFFRMVGSQQGQSFHEQMASSGFFSNPLTMVVEGSKLPGAKRAITFAPGATTVAGGDLNVLNNTVDGIAKTVATYPSRPFHVDVTGLATADEAHGTALARAQYVHGLLRAAGVPDDKIGMVSDGAAARNAVELNSAFKEG